MKKIICILLVTIMCFLTACSWSKNVSKTDNGKISVYTDGETGVEYIVYSGVYKGGITPRLNPDGSVRVNDENSQ